MKILIESTSRVSGRGRAGAFSMLEVVIASAIFFMVAFSILGLVTSSLASARRLQQRSPDPGLKAAAIAPTNFMLEGSESGDFEDIYPGLYPGYRWGTDAVEVRSNGLYLVTITVHHTARRGPSATTMEILMYCPDSPPGSASSF